ncbi:MAG: Fe-S cluster assembly protein SufD [Pseudomonadales bacterium]|nr:Fe-S cluster assembly protein SufD [Pseudomonadales bacterium]
MNDFQQQALQLAAHQHSPQWLQVLRTEGARTWLHAAWPDRKTELWKYTSLNHLQQQHFKQWAVNDNSWQDKLWQEKKSQVNLIPMEATRLVFVNGQLDSELSTSLPEEVSLFSQADAAAQTLITRHLGQIQNTERNLFAALSNAWVEEGVLLHVPANVKLSKPLYVVHIATATAEAAVSSQRLLLVLDAGAEACVIEHYLSTAEPQNGFLNTLTEISLGDNASLYHSRISLEQEALLHIGGVHANLGRDSSLTGFTLAEGSQLKRIDYQINHRDSGAQYQLDGVYLARNSQFVDYHVNVEHCAPHCTTSEVFRGIVGDSARAVFNGRIHIHKNAQKTLAELSNRNLLTSDRAEIDTKPELEIYADDVRCAHGATISQLDSTAMYYLQSRGISRRQARVMLSFGFINELLYAIPQPEVQDYLQQHLTALFAEGESLLGETEPGSGSVVETGPGTESKV